jgi:hypothetical protein
MLKDKLRRIHELVGQLATEVSDIDLGWYLLFTCMMHQSPREITDAIINVHKTGEGQRQTIMATAKAVFPADSEELKFIGQLKARTDDLIGRRNAAIHSIIAIGNFIIPPTIIAAGTSKPSKLADKDIEKELESCLLEADTLAHTLQGFMSSLGVRGKASPALERLRPAAGWKNPLSDSPAK